jgi:AmmeMemoRadiSam system protein A
MSPPQRNSSSATNPSNHVGAQASGPPSAESATHEFSNEDRILLLNLAHESILAALEHRQISLEAPSPHLAEQRGVFTSLHHRGNLRGCVGYVLPVSSLYRAVAETARAAAFDDTRFPPLIREEIPDLRVELSILSAPQPISAEALEVGRHGLLITMHGNRGLLLPQVAVEHGWDRTTFLEQTCRKACLPLDAWQKGATIEAFTAEVFAEQG